MTLVRYAVHVDATPERVWEVVSDPRHLPRWDRHVERVREVPKEGLGEGAAYTTVMRFMTVRATVRARVVEWEPPRRAVVHLSGPILEATVTTTVEQANRGSVLRHEVEYRFRGGPLGEIAARSLQLVGGARLALRHGTLAQKRDIEQGGG